MAEPKYKRVSDVPSKRVTIPAGLTPRDTWTARTPDGRYFTFYSAEDAQKFIDLNYPNHAITEGNFGQEMSVPAGSDAAYVQELPEVTVVGQRPSPAPSPATPTRRGIDMYIGRNYSPRFNKAYNELGMNPFKWPERAGLYAGGRNASYWDSDIHKAVHEGNNIAAGIAAAPFAAYTAAEAAPFVWQGGKWLLNTAGRAMLPSEWASGLAQYFPRFAPQLQIAGQLGNVAVASSLAVPGAQNIYEGIKEGDYNRALHGATDVAFSLPFLQEARPMVTLANGRRAFTPVMTAAPTAAPAASEGAFFSPTARAATTAGAIATPMVAAASDAQQANPEGSWYGNLWQTIRENPAESALAAWMLYRGGRGLRNRYLREPAGRPAKFNEPQPVRGEGELLEPYEPRMMREPVREDYMMTVNRPEPSMPRPTEFVEPAPARPEGLRPKGKKGKQWDKRNRAYQDWEARRDAHNQALDEARRAWEEYDYSPSYQQVDEEGFNRAHSDWEQNRQRWYDADMAQYNRDREAYQAEQQRLDAGHQQATRDWESRRDANAAAVKAYEEGEPYQKWLARRQNWINRKDWAKRNWVGLGLGSWVIGSHLFGGDGTPTNTNDSTTNQPDSIPGLPEGFRPIQEYNDQTGEVVVPSVSRRPDSIVTLEPLTRNRFGRGENQSE